MKIFNTLTGGKEEFQPANPQTVHMYVCGVTPYASAHVGHALSYVVFDVVRRYLEYRGYKVKHVQNFTDIDDRLIERGTRLGVSPMELAERYIAEFHEEMDALNVQRADLYPRATQELPMIVEVIEGLVRDGYAYASDGDVYFRVKKDEEYGKLSHRTLDGMMAGTRVQHGERKEFSMDFALWKGAKEGEPEWPSPWGPGRPGWHIECSAMALRHLDGTVDIHGGGQDLVFPHHENEIAQSEAFTGHRPFARVWMHNGLLMRGEEKMSKSLGNLFTVKEALSEHPPDALRLFFLSSHYRSPLTVTDDALDAADRGAERLRNAAATVSGHDGAEVEADEFRNRFLESMDDDFNTPQAIAALFDLAREINRGSAEGLKTDGATATLKEFAGVLGITLQEPDTGASADVGPFIELLLHTRAELREAKQYALADGIRDRLSIMGVSLEDGPEGTRWKYRGSGDG